MADEIKLKAPTVEQQVVVNISGEDKLEKFADTLDKISKGRGLQKYWKDQQTLINDTIKAYNNFNKSTSQTDATELIKTTNALKAMAGVDISTLIPDFDKFTSALSKAEGIAGHLTDAFTEKAFRDAFSSFETLKAYGLDLENFFKHFEFNADVDKLVSELNNANDAVSNLKSKVTQLEDKLEESESGNGIRAVREECENLRWEIERIRDEAAETFSAFLTSNNINAGSYQYEEFFERIREGSLTAQEAIAEFKRDYSYLLEGGASFDTTQLQDFSRRLDDVLKRITDVSEKIDYISSNGVRVSDFGGSGSGNFEELANVVNQIENTNINGSASAIYESLSKILTAIKEIGQCDTDNLYHLYSTIRNLAQLNDLKVNKASLDNLADCLERICRIDNSSALTNLSLVNFKNFNDLHISKASLNNLAEYLPQISNIDVGTLTVLASLDFDKLNSLHIDKDSMKNLFSFVEGLKNATGLTDFTTENKNVEYSADASTSSLKTEAELMESIATNAEKAAKAKKEFVEANKELAKATETSATALSKENSELGEMGDKSNISSPIKDTFQGEKIEQATTSAKELDKTLEQVNVPKESFDDVIAKFNIIEDKAKNIVKITKDMHQDSNGKPIESYNITYKDGSNESYGENSNPQLLRGKDVLYDAKEQENKKLEEQKRIYKELNNEIDRYATVSKRIANGKALSSDEEELAKLQSRIEELQNEPILSKEQLEASQLKLEKLEATLEDIQEITRNNNIDSMQSEIDAYNKRYNNLNIKPSDKNRSVDYQKAIDNYKNSIGELETFLNRLRTSSAPITEEIENQWNEITLKVDKASDAVKAFSAAEKGSDEDGRMKEIDKLTKYLDKNTRISKKAKQELEHYLDILKSGDPSVNVKKIHTAWTEVAVAERAAGREGKRFFDIISDKALYGQAAQLAGYYLSLTDFIRYGKQAVDTIIELDTALIDLKKTTAMSGSEMENFYFEANDVAKEMGVTTQAIIEQSSAWSRLGYNTKEASTEMAKLSSKFATISPGMDTDTAQEGLVSIMKAWDIDVDQVESEVIDKINTLGNNFAEENQDIVEGMKRSAAALASTGTTYQDAFALFTGAQEVLQNSEVTGRALRSISMRIHGYSENSEDGLAELDEELTNITGDLIDLTKTAEHTQGVSIFKDGSTTEFKSLVDYFGEINAIWDEMSQKQQNDFLQMAFGKTQAQAGAALIQNYESVVGALEKMEQSAGSADAEMAAVESSLNYKINSLKETWVGTVQEMIDRGDLGVIIDGLVKLSEAIGFVLDKAGLLGTAGIIGGGILGVKNAGICV